MRRLALIIGGAILVAPYSCSALAGTVNGFVRDRAMTGNGKTNSARSHSLIATGMDGQKEKGQKAVDQQPVTKEKQAAPSQSQPGSLVTRVGLKADGNNTGRCPLTVNFTGFITTTGSGDVQYTFIRSDGIAGPVLSAHFKDAGTQAVTTSWGLGEGSDQPHYEGWAAIRILSPNQLESSHETGSFSITCAPRSVARVGDASASPLLRGTFEVFLLGFTVDHQTRDDSLQRDGAGDEVFLVSPSDFLIHTSSREIRRSVGGHGAVYGQRRSSRSAVIQAGTASETGGLRTGDQFPQPTPWVYRNDGIAGDAITHVFFLGEITQGANVLAVIPSLWEWDNNDEGIQHSYVDMMADQNLARAVSDYDLTHQVNLNWIADIPVGKGRPLAHNANGVLDAFIGGWQLSGLARWTSGFPYSVDGGQRWPTDWFLTGIAQMTAKPKTGIYHLTVPDPVTGKPNSFVSPFADPAAAQNAFTLPLPGGVGSRNVLRGDGFASWDMSLAKRWKMPYRETHNLQFRWEVFNVPNLTRFNAQGVGASLLTSLTQSPGSFGAYTSLLTQPRVMQFALRYEF